MAGTGSFDPTTLLMKFDPLLLGEFAVKQEIDFIIHDTEEDEERVDRFLSAMYQQDGERQGETSKALHDISDMSGYRSIEYLENVAERQQKSIDYDVYAELPNHKSRALWFYLNHEDIFNASVDERQFEDVSSWKSVIVPIVDLSLLTNGMETLKASVQHIFPFANRITRCKIKTLDRPDRICIVAHVEDRPVNDLKFKDGEEQLTPDKPRRPILRAYIQYWPDENQLEVKVKGGKPKVEALQRAVVEDVLGLRFEDCDAGAYSLDILRVLEPDPLVIADEEHVESVRLKQLSMRDRRDGSKVTITVGNTSQKGVEAMKRLAEYRRVNFVDFEILNATIEIICLIDGKRRPVTFDITHGKHHNLKSRKQDLLVRKLLKKWGIATAGV